MLKSFCLTPGAQSVMIDLLQADCYRGLGRRSEKLLEVIISNLCPEDIPWGMITPNGIGQFLARPEFLERVERWAQEESTDVDRKISKMVEDEWHYVSMGQFPIYNRPKLFSCHIAAVISKRVQEKISELITIGPYYGYTPDDLLDSIAQRRPNPSKMIWRVGFRVYCTFSTYFGVRERGTDLQLRDHLEFLIHNEYVKANETACKIWER